jgi:hypothetical protein
VRISIFLLAEHIGAKTNYYIPWLGHSVGPNHRLTRFSSDRAFFADLELRTLAVSRSCNDLLPAPLPAPYPPTSAARTHPETAT